VRRLEAVCLAHATPLAAAALQFPLAHPQVASVIPGMSSPAQVRQALAWAAARDPRRPVGRPSREGLLHPDAPEGRDEPDPAASRRQRAGAQRRRCTSGEALTIDGRTATADADVEVGHKLARHALAVGDKVLKYGAPIGSMTAAAAPGDWVHMHNMKSDYIASHTRQATGSEDDRDPGYLRQDGRKGIRNVVAVAYLVECAHHVARADRHKSDDPDVHLIGFPGCYPNAYAAEGDGGGATHPNVGGVLLISLGCESFNREQLRAMVEASGRPVETLVIQESGGTASDDRQGRGGRRARLQGDRRPDAAWPDGVDELVIGTICGGSDGTSGITANPAVGRAFDRLGAEGAACIFEETGELVGCETHHGRRAADARAGPRRWRRSVHKAEAYYTVMGYGSFAPGNAEGGLTTQEEKSMGAYSKSGSAPIVGILKPGDQPPSGGLYLLDVVPDGEPRFGFPTSPTTPRSSS
jgi:altronate dehydratase